MANPAPSPQAPPSWPATASPSPFNSADVPVSAPAWTPPASDHPAASPFNSADVPVIVRTGHAAAPWSPPSSAYPVQSPFSAADKLAAPAPIAPNDAAQPARSPPLADRPASTNPLDAARNSAGGIVSGLGQFGSVVDAAIARASPAWLARGLGATGDLAGGADQAVVDAGTAISGPNQYQPAPVHQLGADLAAGKPLAVLDDGAGLIAGAVPYAATALIPGAGPALLGASGAGSTIAQRMQNKGETSPSMGDAAAGAAAGILNAVGGDVAHGLAGSIVTPAAERLLGKSLAGQIAGRAAVSGAAGGTLGSANNVLADAGTGNLTPGSVASAGLEGAGSGLLTGGAIQGTKDAAAALHTVLAERGSADLHPEQASSIVRVGAMANQRVAEAKAVGQNLSPTSAMDTLGTQLDGELQAHISALKAGGQITPATQQAVIMPLLAQARSGSLMAADGGVQSSPLGQFDKLGLPPAAFGVLRDGLLDLSTINRDGGTGRGLVAPLVDKLVNHSTARVLEAALGATAGYHSAGAEGAALGGAAGVALPAAAGAVARGLDSMIGANTPPILGRQQNVAAAALARAGLPAPASSLDTLQAARQAQAGADNGPSPEAVGAARAASNQAGMVARLGPDHPVGAAALTALQATNPRLANQARAQYGAMSGVRDAGAAGAAYNAATAHQRNLDAADATPGGPVGIDAINAAQNELTQKAAATMRLAGGRFNTGAGGNRPAGGSGGAASGILLADSQNAAGGPAGTSGSNIPGGGQTASTDSTTGPRGSGLMGLADHLSGQALWGAGVPLSPAELQAGLEAAAAAGKIAPDQFGVLQQHLAQNEPLHHTGGAATGVLNALVSHAVALKTGGAVAPVLSTGTAAAAGAGGRDRPAIYSPTRYATTATSNQAHLTEVATRADAAGEPDLASAARQLRATKSVAARVALRDGVVNARLRQGDLAGAARVRAMLPDALLQAGDKAGK